MIDSDRPNYVGPNHKEDLMMNLHRLRVRDKLQSEIDR
jgi:hypothetical protein